MLLYKHTNIQSVKYVKNMVQHILNMSIILVEVNINVIKKVMLSERMREFILKKIKKLLNLLNINSQQILFMQVNNSMLNINIIYMKKVQ